MSPNNLGNYLTIEGCSKIRLRDILAETKRQMKATLASIVLEEKGHTIHITSTSTNFHGKRLWLICPNCGTRRSFLYNNPISGLPQCRKCLGIAYKGQRYKGMLEAKEL